MSKKFFAAPAAVLAMGTSLALGFVTMPAVPAAHADDTLLHSYWVDPATGEAYRDVVLVSESDLDSFPVCVEEDCSDQPNQVGMWLDSDTGNWYLELGESCTGAVPAVCESVTYLVIDNTVTEGGAR